MEDLTKLDTTALAQRVYTDSTLHSLRLTDVIKPAIRKLFIYTKEQMSSLDNDLDNEKLKGE